MSASEKGEGPSCWSCDEDPIGALRRMFVDIVQARRIRLGQDPARRPVFLKLHGVAHGRFEPLPELAPELRVGVFGGPPREAWVRFSSDTLPTLPDLRSTLGVGVKLFGVPGAKLLGDGDTQDFLLQNHDVFFVDDLRAMCEFTRAGVVEGDYEPYLRAHPETRRVLKEMEKVELSVLTTTYWSVLPYAFGEGRSVKYVLEPEARPDGLPSGEQDYLAGDLARRLRAGEARFRFLVQLRTDPERMPLDRATVRWSPRESPPVHVATLVLPRQDVELRGQAEYGDNLAFNPWHALAEHAPQGSIAEARKVVYAASADRRRDANGVPTREPGPARPAAASAAPDACIVRAAIHPSIGIARVGDSQDEWFLGPEVNEPPPHPPGFHRDASGALKRQAARFRVYGLDAEGRVVRELTADEAEIRWTVHLANQKAAWYQFQLALDVPEAASAPPSMLRNAGVADRAALAIDPGPRHAKGRDQHGGAHHVFDTGTFLGRSVYLGELRTDEAGRLIVLGGRGVSASHDESRAVTFANNEGWHDDVSDGPVTAEVVLDGRRLAVAPAWVVVAPPDYAPQQKSVRTMWDLMRDLAFQRGLLPRPARPSFTRDIAPIFQRLSALQWVNAGFAAAFGWKGPSELGSPEWLARLSKDDPSERERRRTIANQFRVFATDSYSPKPWPWLYGDAMNVPPADTPRQNAALSDTQLAFLRQWAAGDFEADWDPRREPPRCIDEVPVAEQADMLDRAALEFCLADAFHPGCEMTWPMRAASMYMGPFRVAHAEPGWIPPSFGAQLDSGTLSLPDGPLGPQLPGGITRWMAVPWQTDTASCRSGYTPEYDPYVPTFWPARVPNEVLTREDYELVMDRSRPMGERLAAFARRAAWIRPLGSKSYTDQINNMIERFGAMGVVEPREGPRGEPDFPETMQVEDLPRRGHRLLAEAAPEEAPERAAEVDLRHTEKARRFPHGLRR